MKREKVTQYSRTGYIFKTILINNTFFSFNKIITNNHLLDLLKATIRFNILIFKLHIFCTMVNKLFNLSI